MKDVLDDDFELLTQGIHRLRLKASEVRPKRHSHAELHELLGQCMVMCERAEKLGCLDLLKEQATSQLKGRNRSYFESTADVYLVVGRLVFEGEKRRDAAWRYTAVMREASKRGIAGADLPKWLQSNGGLNALFRARGDGPKAGQTKTIFLNTPVDVPSVGGEITLTLKRCPTGFFDVVGAGE